MIYRVTVCRCSAELFKVYNAKYLKMAVQVPISFFERDKDIFTPQPSNISLCHVAMDSEETECMLVGSPEVKIGNHVYSSKFVLRDQDMMLLLEHLSTSMVRL